MKNSSGKVENLQKFSGVIALRRKKILCKKGLWPCGSERATATQISESPVFQNYRKALTLVQAGCLVGDLGLCRSRGGDLGV